jgi:bifunctional non-homologous end joining protein LigD
LSSPATHQARESGPAIFGYDGGSLLYAGRTRSGFIPASREKLFRRFRGLEISGRPFVNLPQAGTGRWIHPALAEMFESVEWTPDGYLSPAGFMGLRDDKEAKDVVRENAC